MLMPEVYYTYASIARAGCSPELSPRYVPWELEQYGPFLGHGGQQGVVWLWQPTSVPSCPPIFNLGTNACFFSGEMVAAFSPEPIHPTQHRSSRGQG